MVGSTEDNTSSATGSSQTLYLEKLSTISRGFLAGSTVSVSEVIQYKHIPQSPAGRGSVHPVARTSRICLSDNATLEPSGG